MLSNNMKVTKTFHEQLESLLSKHEFAKTEEFCLSKENSSEVSENGWDLLSLLMDFLKVNKVEGSNAIYFDRIFEHIATVSNQKEIFLGILEQFDPLVSSNLLLMLFSSLTKCCHELIKKDIFVQSNNIEMVFSTLSYYMESINLPNYTDFKPGHNIEPAEEAYLCKFLLKCVCFTSYLYTEIFDKLENKSPKAFKDVEGTFISFCCVLLERLSHLDLEENSTSNEKVPLVKDGRKSIQVACSICELIRKLKPPHVLFQTFLWSEFSSQPTNIAEERKVCVLARGVYLYLNFVKLNVSFYFPQVLHPHYVLCFSIPSILAFWEKDNPVQNAKGMDLAQFATDRVTPLTLTSSYFNHRIKASTVQEGTCQVIVLASRIAIHCPVMVLRQRAVQFIRQFCDKFEWPDRYNLLLHLLKTTVHPGLVGYFIGYFKDKLNEIFQLQAYETNYFLMFRNLRKVFDICFDLPDGSETDLLSNYDKIISSLNLLRYLLIRNKLHSTGVLKYLQSLKTKFLEPLQTNINLSRMHFRTELNNLSSSTKSNESVLYLNGISLSSIPFKDREQALHSAINTFDVLQSLCVRVEELTDQLL